jgi:hypothetical protein
MATATLVLLDHAKIGDTPERAERCIVRMFVLLTGREPTAEERANLRAEIADDLGKS